MITEPTFFTDPAFLSTESRRKPGWETVFRDGWERLVILSMRSPSWVRQYIDCKLDTLEQYNHNVMKIALLREVEDYIRIVESYTDDDLCGRKTELETELKTLLSLIAEAPVKLLLRRVEFEL